MLNKQYTLEKFKDIVEKICLNGENIEGKQRLEEPESQLNLDSIIIMIQKEVADRIVANPGSKLSGAITYAVHYYSKPESIKIVPNSSFIPAPKVDSEVIKLQIRKTKKGK